MRATARLLILLVIAGQPLQLLAADYFGQVTFNGLPVPGATVTAVQGESKASVTTDQDGIYHFADLADGTWRLAIQMPGFSTVTREINVPAEKEGPASTLTVRSLDDITRAVQPPPALSSRPI